MKTWPRLLLCLLLLSACAGPRGPEPTSPAPTAEVAPPPSPAPEAPLPPEMPGQGLVAVPAAEMPRFRDDGGLRDLAASVEQSITYYRALPPETTFAVGPERVSAARMLRSLEAFQSLLGLPPDQFSREVRRRFQAYRSRGSVTFSAYYEHALDAALERGGEYQFPLYARPTDLVETETPRGRTVNRRAPGGALVPYYTRKEIDSDGALEGRGLEIAWAADPVEIFFLQVQGSGWLRLPDGEMLRVRYAAHNGHPYRSVGGHMIQKGLMGGEGNAREKLVRYMREHREERQELLNVNPRYVFFQLDRGPDAPFAIGSLRRPLTPRRSVAADPLVFPRGALAWMETESPQTSRFVLCQDEGGAIKGPTRIDYFVGAGREAEAYAVTFWTTGRFYVLLLKDSSEK